MPASMRWSHVMLSLVVPGWGQFEQGRPRAGTAFLAWGAATVVGAPLVLSAGIPAWSIVAEFAILTVWSALDSLAHSRTHGRPRGRGLARVDARP